MTKNAARRRQQRLEKATTLSLAELQVRFIDPWCLEYRRRVGESLESAKEFQQVKILELRELAVDEMTISGFIAACAEGRVPTRLIGSYDASQRNQNHIEVPIVARERRSRRALKKAGLTSVYHR